MCGLLWLPYSCYYWDLWCICKYCRAYSLSQPVVWDLTSDFIHTCMVVRVVIYFHMQTLD